MRVSAFTLLVASVVPWLVSAHEEAPVKKGPTNVLDLTKDTFESTISKEALLLVEFFAPWCGHCKALAPEYDEASVSPDLTDKGIKLAKVDCVDQADLCGELKIAGYPTLKVYRNGTPSDYSGPRKAEGIVNYLVKQSLPAVSEVTVENFEKFQKSDKVVVLALASSTDDAHLPAFSAAASTHRDSYIFGSTTDAEVIKAAGVKTPAIVVYTSFDDGRIDFPSADIKEATAGSITQFIKDNSVPLIDEISGENYAVYAESGLPLAYLFVDPEDKNRDTLIESIRPIAKEYKGVLNFVSIDAAKFSEHGKTLALEPQWPAFVISEVKTQLKYPLNQSKALTAKAVAALVKEFASGKIEPTLKSEAVPEQTEKYFQLVGTEFEKVVYDDEKDVFVQFSAPWCGHCKKLLPTWEELGEHYTNLSDKLVIAKMDGTENDLPVGTPFTIEGFPTMKFKPAGSKEFIDYGGDRSLENLIEFIEENAKNDVKIPRPVAKKVEETVVEDVIEEGVSDEPGAEPVESKAATKDEL